MRHFLEFHSSVAIHEIYVDEVQDFTQAELKLLLRLCRDPTGLFLTGDTAQTIARGVGFRFEDVKTMLYTTAQSDAIALNDNERKTCSEFTIVEDEKESESIEDEREIAHVAILSLNSPISAPKVHQLTYNFRSHSDMLYLASSVVDVLYHYFPNAVDRLEPDQGLYPGPKPILLEVVDFTDLAMLLANPDRTRVNLINFCCGCQLIV